MSRVPVPEQAAPGPQSTVCTTFHLHQRSLATDNTVTANVCQVSYSHVCIFCAIQQQDVLSAVENIIYGSPIHKLTTT